MIRRPRAALGPLRSTGGAGSGGLRRRLSELGGSLPPRARVALVVGLLGLVWVVVCSSGGSRTAMPHLFYLPILAAAFLLSLRGAILTAGVAALLAGPLMPDDPQPVLSWLFRGLMFTLVAATASISLSLHDRRREERSSQDLAGAITGRRDRLSEDRLVPLVPDVLRHQRFHPVFQPIYSLTDGSLVAVEALTRFDVEPSQPPDVWFAAARRAGHGAALETAAIQAALGCAGDLPDTARLCVNASPATLAHPALHALLGAGRRPTLTLELTEHDIIDCYEALRGRLVPLRSSGLMVSVDDAGAGFSTLQHIVQLSPDVIKLDASLTGHLDSSPARQALGRSLVEFAHSTGATLVVEGIEREADLALWTRLGADAAQGYLLGRPGALPAAPTSPLICALLAR